MESVIGPDGSTVMPDTGNDDSRRLVFAALIAALVHAALIAIPFLDNAMRPLSGGPMVVDLEARDIQLGRADAEPVRTEVAATAAVRTSEAETGSDFVIPTPKQTAAARTPQAAQRFREEGDRTGVLPGATTAAPPGPRPEFPLDAGASSASPAAEQAPPPTGGTGVQVTGQTQAAEGSLDLKSLDKALAGARTGRDTGTRATAKSGPGSPSGGSGIKWEKPEAARNRRLLSSREPEVPAWVGKQGLTLTVMVYFIVSSQGVVSSTGLEKSSGYGDVDAAALEAVRFYRFSPDPASASIKGSVPIKIHTR
jgi:protein TonB